MGAITESSRKIADIVGVIDSIACMLPPSKMRRWWRRRQQPALALALALALANKLAPASDEWEEF
ncbi:hypothetical protein [Janthinobacterium sp. HLX7-2]|uniref:hypothetical protein n=1 Tax=Janthinobacterium sp. HLX7-2 TaxID=1259331 RepID=UPI003F2960D9